MRAVLALDVGTTAIKAALFDLSGRPHAIDACEYDLRKPAPEQVELDAEVYWSAAKSVIHAVLRATHLPPSAIAAVGVTSQGETLIVTDRNGRPLRPAIVWLDNRSREEAEALSARFPLDTIYRLTGQQEMAPTWTATRLLWLRAHEPAVFAHAARFLLPADFLLFKLTGRFATHPGLNPSTLYFDLTRRAWWPDMLDALGIDANRLPDLLEPFEPAGRLRAAAAADTGLPAGIPVCGAPIDQVAGAVGAGNLDAGLVTETTGAALALAATLDQPLYDPQKRAGLYLHALPNRYVLLPWVPTAGMALRWFRDALAEGATYDSLTAEAEQTPPGADGVRFLPHLCGAGSPRMDPNARGAFAGFSLRHRRGHLVRAILEAVAFMLRENLEMLASLGHPVSEIRSLGGGARSPLWIQIKADVCHKPVLTMACAETTSLGTAMIAGVAAGLFPALETARDQMVRVHRQTLPREASQEAYAAAYGDYLRRDRVRPPSP